ncbi:hypothetical protein OR1_04210 [Geobacter sp. OR-1]|nr:hypothetical protein OR1_04210 [Geobacter sp. OR-1]
MRVSPQVALLPKWQLMLLQVLLTPLSQANWAVVPFWTMFRTPLIWVVLSALMAVPVRVVSLWQLEQVTAPDLVCFLWLLARRSVYPALA